MSRVVRLWRAAMARPLLADSMLAVALAALSVVVNLSIPRSVEDAIAGPSTFGVVMAIAGALPLVARRRWPIATMVVITGVLLTIQAFEHADLTAVATIIACYTFGSIHGGRTFIIGGLTVWLLMMAWVAVGISLDKAGWGALISNGVIFATAFLVGDNVRRRRERQAELLERAERAERERELLAQQRVQGERTRIARELHDIVAHSVSLMVIQAGAARRSIDHDPDRAKEMLTTSEDTGRRAMAEMRRVLGVLREGSDTAGATAPVELAPQPSFTTIERLVAESTDLPVTLHADDSLGDVPPGVELSAYRIVQEGLTNVRRHAGRVDAVEVVLRRIDDQITVEILDDGRGAAAGERNADGFGLIGMRERIGMYDGQFAAGPRQGGGWRLHAVIPVGGA